MVKKRFHPPEFVNFCLTGNVEETAALLGRQFRTVGTVVHGEKRGRLLGFPTANVLPDDNTILPANGVYAVRFIGG